MIINEKSECKDGCHSVHWGLHAWCISRKSVLASGFTSWLYGRPRFPAWPTGLQCFVFFSSRKYITNVTTSMDQKSHNWPCLQFKVASFTMAPYTGFLDQWPSFHCNTTSGHWEKLVAGLSSKNLSSSVVCLWLVHRNRVNLVSIQSV